MKHIVFYPYRFCYVFSRVVYLFPRINRKLSRTTNSYCSDEGKREKFNLGWRGCSGAQQWESGTNYMACIRYNSKHSELRTVKRWTMTKDKDVFALAYASPVCDATHSTTMTPPRTTQSHPN